MGKLRRRLELASKLPWAGRMVPELSNREVREVIVRGYRLVDRVERVGITVLTIFEGHRRLSEP